MKHIKQKMKKFFCKYINGTKGVISIFLVLVMLPFSSIALMLVQSARYQHAVELVDELLDCVGLSTIADYDSFMESRFGLLSLAQDSDYSANYQKYLNANVGALDNSFVYSNSSVSGLYPLSDLGVLESQMLEFGEVTVMVEALYKGLDIDSLLKELYKKMGVDEINKIADATTAVSDVAGSAADLINAVKSAIEEGKKYKTQISEYKAAANAFYEKSDALIKALESANSTAEEGDDIYDDDNVKDAVKDLEKARDTFKREAGEMSASVLSMRSNLDKLFTTLSDISEKLNEAKSSMDDVNGTTLQEKTTTTTFEWVLEVVDQVTLALELTVTSTYSTDMLTQSRALDQQKIALGKVVCNKAWDGVDTNKYYIYIASVLDQIKSDFPIITMDSVDGTFVSVMDSTIKDLDKNESSISEEQAASIGKLLDLAAELLKVSAFYDDSLDSNVSTTAFYEYRNDMRFSSAGAILALTTVVQSGQDFVDSLLELNILKAFAELANFLLAIAEFLVSVVAWVVEVAVNVFNLVASGSEIYDTFLMQAYGVYNMPCRTTATSGKGLAGYSYTKVFEMMGGVDNNRITGSMSDLNTLLAANGSGADSGFKGAEVEYLLIGGTNEMLNQAAAFFNLYMLRLVFNLGPILTNSQVATMAGSATIAGWAVYLAIIIAEPMLDALLLVNGISSYMIKKSVYLTPGGMILLIQTLPQLTGLPDSLKNQIKDVMVAKDGEPKLDGTFKFDYQEHMLILLLLTTDQDTYLRRMRNLIQMEAEEYYKGDLEFSLDDAYTYLEISVDGSLNSMFDMEALTNGGPFEIHRTRIVGY